MVHAEGTTEDPIGSPQSEPQRGFVSLVGAGPGDPGLITVRGRDRIAQADVVVYDRLVHPELLDLTPASAERIYIGKAYGRHVLEQEELSNLLVFLAAQGKRVVRLKGGDPFVYGRGGEEAGALALAGIDFEIVPGISSAVAAPAYAGIPVTDRRYASSVVFVTGHRSPDAPDNTVDWRALGRSVDTIVILMGTRHYEEITAALVEGGKPATTPVAVVESGTCAEQRTTLSTLGSLASDLAVTGMASPSVIVVGEVVRLHETLAWFEERTSLRV